MVIADSQYDVFFRSVLL